VVGETVTDAQQCCSKYAPGNVCQAVPVPAGTSYTCKTLGEVCAAGVECCSTNCQGGTCVAAYTCHATGDLCTRTEDCCSGLCIGATGSQPGRCDQPDGGCTQDGIPCENDSNCCTRSCKDMGSGVKVCQPAGGCRMTGDFCDQTASCCGGSDPDDPLGTLNPYGIFCDSVGRSSGPPEGDTSTKDERLCTGGQACNPPGNICGYKASQNCCYEGGGSGKAVCKPDAGGILRCFGGPVNTTCPTGWDANDPQCCIQPGDVCQFRDQCCGGSPCVPDQDGVLRCAEPTAQCKPRGTECAGASDATCCEGTTCQQPSESPSWYCLDSEPTSTCTPDGAACGGTGALPCCAGPGACVGGACAVCTPNSAACETDGQCCSANCDGGVCRAACVPADGSCTVNGDCCAGLTCDVPAGATAGTCKGTSVPVCSGTGQSCGSNADCCNHDPGDPASEFCDEGTCALPAPTCAAVAQTCTVSGGTSNCCAPLQCLTTSDIGDVPCASGDNGCFCGEAACRQVNESCTMRGDGTSTCCGGGLYCGDATTSAQCDAGSTSCRCLQAG
jgi:hypothetical protein